MRLFDDISRDDGRPMRDDESAFDFLNRVDRPYWAAIRDELEDWFAAFPTEEAESLRSRYRSRRREQHYAAWWELYLHRLFRALGFQVAVHPRLPGVGGRPDFLISNGQDRFLLEAATTFSGVVDPDRDEDRENWLRATIRGIRNPNFFVSLHVQVAGRETPSVREIVGPIERWLESLDADEILATQDIPERRFAPRDWEFELHALPVSLEHRGDPDHEILGSYMGAVGWINDAEKLRRALENKRRKYGTPEVPLVVAVLLMSTYFDDGDVEKALLGDTAFQYYQVQSPGEERPHDGKFVRLPNGFWYQDGRPRGTRVAGVLTGIRIFPETMMERWPRLWHNPWATHPLRVRLPFPLGVAHKSGRVSYEDTEAAPGTYFDLPLGWPGTGDPFGDD